MAAAIATRPFAPSPSHPPLPTTRAHPHKHMPYCPPGPRPAPSRLDAAAATAVCAANAAPQPPALTSLTYPPDSFPRLNADPPVFAISAAQLDEALEHLASQPLPAAQHVFPWLHGLHAENQVQLAFFVARRKAPRRAPRCLRGITIVKAGGDLSHSRLRGAIAPEELLRPCPPLAARRHQPKSAGPGAAICGSADDASDDSPCFLDVDPRDGFGVRNFHIQACKMATVSDIVVYGDLTTPRVEVETLALRISQAQEAWRRSLDPRAASTGERAYNTFVLSDAYDFVETDHPDLVALDSEGCMTGKVLDFFHRERVEMYSMTAPSEICHNVWLGPTPDPALNIPSNHPSFDLMIEASDLAQLPDSRAFDQLDDVLEHKDNSGLENLVPQLEFPSSGAIAPPTWSQEEVDGLLTTVEWIHGQANACRSARRRRDSKLSLSPSPERSGQARSNGRSILIHCGDGYTESSLLALAYYMYAERVPAHQAWLALHRERGRNFFAYPTDVALLRAIQPRILQASPRQMDDMDVDSLQQQLCPPTPAWFDRMDGSLPSRIFDYMYLGNLGHANNPGLLRELGIGQILSVGEPLTWSREETERWPAERLMFVDQVQDNGVDPLIDEFDRCLQFIEKGRRNGTATLVHCRVGVSRSATICIAEVMNELGLSFPRAYCFVRARRLNVIIQPHLRFCYELLHWEETIFKKRGRPLRRELEWASIAREIALMNKPYAKQR